MENYQAAPPPIVEHVADTALWVAAVRARESRRPDALFHDPLADRLIGARGRHLDAHLRLPARGDWPLVVRTRLIDELVVASLADGADRVINLAAGLDTRPYRLDLPASLTWIEADLARVIDDKERALAGERPRCALVRERVDLVDAAARAAFLDRALDGAARALILVEGLLIYLDDGQVRAIARDLHGRPAIAWWMLDLASPRIVAAMRRKLGAQLGAGAEMRFAPPDGVGFFRPLGWVAHDVRSLFHEAGRLRRLPWYVRPFARLPPPDPERPGNKPWGAVVRLVRR